MNSSALFNWASLMIQTAGSVSDAIPMWGRRPNNASPRTSASIPSRSNRPLTKWASMGSCATKTLFISASLERAPDSGDFQNALLVERERARTICLGDCRHSLLPWYHGAVFLTLGHNQWITKRKESQFLWSLGTTQ